MNKKIGYTDCQRCCKLTRLSDFYFVRPLEGSGWMHYCRKCVVAVKLLGGFQAVTIEEFFGNSKHGWK
jgi:late competence protein required for DNA uptake (superfamily II DNA/RNA helicase)